jgi:hypothetical protein
MPGSCIHRESFTCNIWSLNLIQRINKNDEPPVCIEAFCYELKYNNSVEFVSDEKLRISKLSL